MILRTTVVMHLHITICPGHVTTHEFNRADRAANCNGWTYMDQASDDDLSHEYLTFTDGVYEFASQDDPEAKPYTIKEW